MKHVARNLILLLAVIAFMAWSVFPPKEKLRLGKDLAGGVSLIYGVDVPPGDTGVLPKVIEVVKDRLDPQGVLEITIVPQGNDRIEITMPLPTSEVKQLKEGVDSEIGKLAASMGANPLTVAGLSGMGDLVLTCTGELSRNRTVGVELGKGRTLGDILATLGHVAEGVKTTKSAYDLGMKMGVDMPITNEVYRVLYEGKSPRQAVVDLMTRALMRE